jgi:hypothetical protein
MGKLNDYCWGFLNGILDIYPGPVMNCFGELPDEECEIIPYRSKAEKMGAITSYIGVAGGITSGIAYHFLK